MLSKELHTEVYKIKTRQECREAFDLIKLRFDALGRAEALKFTVGQSVWFKSRKGDRIEGSVLRVNKKTVSVMTSMGKWNVPPELLNAIQTNRKETK